MRARNLIGFSGRRTSRRVTANVTSIPWLVPLPIESLDKPTYGFERVSDKNELTTPEAFHVLFGS